MAFKINSDIKKAHTLPKNFYTDEAVFETVKEKILASSWQYIGDENDFKTKEYNLFPVLMLENVLDEPLLISVSENSELKCLSNVCTHRGKILVEDPKKSKLIGCGYHGRCFSLDGKFKSMTAFEESENFPSNDDNLHAVAMEDFAGLLFANLNSKNSLSKILEPVIKRVDFLPLQELEYKPELSKTYIVNANWALYCDNYLEGFHVPFVHPALNKALDFKKYKYEIFDYCNLQIGIAKDGEPSFNLPQNHPDSGQNIYAYYFWVFPNMMFNFYPWGLSFNYIQPLSIEKTKVTFRTYKFKNTSSKFEDNNINDTEMEDEAVVESVQKGIKSRFYNRGRFSPTMEKCVHHFHTLLSKSIS